MATITGSARYWLNNGPHMNDAIANAMHHLRRYNFSLYHKVITPLPGYELNAEDRSAIDFLTRLAGFVFQPVEGDMAVKQPPRRQG